MRIRPTAVWVLFVVIVIALVSTVAWAAWVRSQWAAIDDRIESLASPAGFEELGQVRQGSAVCFVSCSKGEPSVTMLWSTELPVEEACGRLEGVVAAVEPRITPTSLGVGCSWGGPDGEDTMITAAVARPADIKAFGPNSVYGFRWAQKTGVPDAETLAWVQVTGRLE